MSWKMENVRKFFTLGVLAIFDVYAHKLNMFIYCKSKLNQTLSLFLYHFRKSLTFYFVRQNNFLINVENPELSFFYGKPV